LLPFFTDNLSLTTGNYYLITLSARASTLGGMVTPICFAVVRLITSLNVGSSCTIVLTRGQFRRLTHNCRFVHTGSVLEELMATLSIKNLPDRLYRKIQARAHREHRSIAQEVIHILSVATENPTPLSILELQGLGKDVWKKLDASKHVNRERRERD
jgi:plasmid stability protein